MKLMMFLIVLLLVETREFTQALLISLKSLWDWDYLTESLKKSNFLYNKKVLIFELYSRVHSDLEWLYLLD